MPIYKRADLSSAIRYSPGRLARGYPSESHWSPGKKVVAVLAVGFSVGGVICLYKAWKKWNGQNAKKNHQKDVVVLHQFPRAKNLPNLSPFAMKVETFLRIANIPYEVDSNEPFGPKGKCPWITLNGRDVADSTFALEFIKDQFKLDINVHLKPSEVAHSTAYRVMAEDHLAWAVFVYRYLYDPKTEVFHQVQFSGVLSHLPMGVFLFLFKKAFARTAWIQGMGRHNKEELIQIGVNDLKSISELLGKKPFCFGEKPCELDCALFGVLCQCMFGATGTPWPDIVKRDFPNLHDFVMRIKQNYWPDWDQQTWNPA